MCYDGKLKLYLAKSQNVQSYFTRISKWIFFLTQLWNIGKLNGHFDRHPKNIPGLLGEWSSWSRRREYVDIWPSIRINRFRLFSLLPRRLWETIIWKQGISEETGETGKHMISAFSGWRRQKTEKLEVSGNLGMEMTLMHNKKMNVKTCNLETLLLPTPVGMGSILPNHVSRGVGGRRIFHNKLHSVSKVVYLLYSPNCHIKKLACFSPLPLPWPIVDPLYSPDWPDVNPSFFYPKISISYEGGWAKQPFWGEG